jgi:transcriptional regulator with GAF, ATPase, and Fis domain
MPWNEGQSRDVDELQARIRDVEIENSNLASLYVALSQLHSTLDVNEVLGAVVEILLNFVGAERFAVLIFDGHGVARPLAAHAVDKDIVPSARPGDGAIGAVLATGQIFTASFQGYPGSSLNQAPVVCLPLYAAGVLIGALPIWSFLQQKGEYSEIDHEIFQLLSKSAGTALEAARVTMTSRREPPDGYFEAFTALIE